MYRLHVRVSSAPNGTALAVLAMTLAVFETSPALAASSRAVTYSPPDMTSISTAQLKHYYKWRHKMDWLLAPIHTRADLEHYLKTTAKSGSPLDALPPDARHRVLANIQFGPSGAFIANTSDLQYLSTEQVYKILALFGEQSLVLEFTDGRIRPASPRVPPNTVKPSIIQKRFDQYLQVTYPVNGGSWNKRSQRVAHIYDHCLRPIRTPIL